jgi:hypothetical protein
VYEEADDERLPRYLSQASAFGPMQRSGMECPPNLWDIGQHGQNVGKRIVGYTMLLEGTCIG